MADRGVPGTAHRTLAAAVENEQEIRRSRFLCFLEPVDSEGSARAHIARVRALHPRARHHCTAFVIGDRSQLQRTSDDGEPSGTAGAPMLDALTANGLTNISAVVVRYFGGVLLGAGGLTRAYRAAVAEAIAGADVRERVPRLECAVTLGYAEAGTLEAEARSRGWAVGTGEYAADVTVHLFIDPADEALLTERVAAITAGNALIEPLGYGFATLP